MYKKIVKVCKKICVKDNGLYGFYLLYALKLSIPVRFNNTKSRVPVSISDKSQLHNDNTPICFVVIKATLAQAVHMEVLLSKIKCVLIIPYQNQNIGILCQACLIKWD